MIFKAVLPGLSQPGSHRSCVQACVTLLLGMPLAAYSVQVVINRIAAVRARLPQGCDNLVMC
ncbi:hypothetical protein [Bradyrhizobium sp. 21]|uniref:hypothetical protein n=1 Tax=Bradyrhizobium sp. 21 TaxID=2782666 RepID=UPI001FFB2411|nr:hypothetical protein [Bradyrhizobium sp. 21]MCK1386645.1 hypothetical protein [Bradyrhizobium sp. 21]